MEEVYTFSSFRIEERKVRLILRGETERLGGCRRRRQVGGVDESWVGEGLRKR